MNKLEGIAEYQLSLQSKDGYWWYTLEANESICAEAIFLMHFLDEIEHEVETGLAKRILFTQREDGTWSLYYGGPPDLSTTIECYWALKLAGSQLHSRDCHAALRLAMTSSLDKARDFILPSDGITNSRVFTKIHLAQFGLVPWDACPTMPVELMLMPTWAPVNIYEFSSWARACIIPLLVVLNKKPVRPIASFNLDELFLEPPSERDWGYKTNKSFLSWERFFIELNKFLTISEKIASVLPVSPFDRIAFKRCEEWISEHIEKTEDIFPALAYGAIALSSLGHPNSYPIIRKAMNALKSFRQVYEDDDIPAVAFRTIEPSNHRTNAQIHQQCCVSPVWDTPWQITALLEAGVKSDNPQLLKAGRWLLSKQIRETYGDWSIKNKGVKPGGWAFEFENDFFPDVDDTIQVIHVLNKLALPEDEKKEPIKRGLIWLLSMQNDDGGWGAFDKNQTLELVNKIPFSDHGACLDGSSPDITGRMLALSAELNVIASASEAMTKALNYLARTQEPFGGWFGRWGVNYIYGTWCVLTGLAAHKNKEMITKAVSWLTSIQHEDGGWSESPETYKLGRYMPYPRTIAPAGVPSQTSWAVMGLIAARSVIPANDKLLTSTSRGIDFLIKNLKDSKTWDEKEFTGTGFPGHFYIRYHGYRHFFPALALARYFSYASK